MFASAVGYLGGVMVALLQLPQLLHTRRTRDTSGLSSTTLAAHTFTGAVWILYGIMLGKMPIILSNCAYLSANLCLVSMMRRYRTPPAPHETEMPTKNVA